ncbi:hypothetical protein WJX79_004834 [Trebouxia sp. C0005]
MLGVERIAGTVVWCCLVGINWIQAQFVHPIAEWWLESVLGTWEESLKSLIREVFAQSDVKPSNGPAGHAESHHARSTPRTGMRWLFGRGADSTVADPDTSSSKKRKLNAQGKSGFTKQQKQRIPAHKKLKRNGSELFDRPAGWAVQEKAKRGFLEDLRIGAELATTAVFDAVRGLVRKVLFMPEKQIFSPLGFDGRGTGWVDDSEGDDSPERPLEGPRLRRTNSFSDWESLHNVWTAAEVIKAAGYPLEQHTVTTSDGYILRMERLPRHGGRDVVFFMHGILDTSMGWVSNGVTGSQAFAAFDQGFDVWLGNSRANPPRVHDSPEMMGAAYWHFTVNQLGEEDIAAQVDFIHMTKCNELNEPSSHNTSHTLKRRRHHYRVRKSHSDTALSALEPDSADKPSAPTALNADGLPAASSQQAVQPLTGLAEQPDAAAAPQAGTGAQPRRRYGLLGLMKRNKSEIGTHSLVPTMFKRFHAQQEVNPQPIAENGIEDDDHSDLFASPRSQLDANSPEGSQTLSIAWQPQQEQRQPEEDLAQLLPDRASADGVERPPQEGFSVDSVGRHGANGFAAFSALPSADSSALELQRSKRQEHHDGDLVAAEQDKVTGEHDSQRSSRRGSHTGQQQSNGAQQDPYRLRAVGHSLGGASLLIYAVTRSMKGKSTHLSRLILLTPAGFQQNYPKAAAPFLWVLPPLVWALHWIRPGVGAACYIPSSLLRYVTFKLTVDMQQIPALNELVRAGIRVLLNGDSSQWDRAMQMPHYNTRSMPSISFHTGMHLIQWIRSGRFQMFKYRNKKSNQAVYGSDEPTDIAENYRYLRMPVDIMAGRSDGVIARENVLMHYQKLQEANCLVTYKEFDFGHLDFTFAVKDDLRHYVLSRLLMDS